MNSHRARIQASLKRRYRAEQRFRWYGRVAVVVAVSALLALFADIVGKGHEAFRASRIQLNIHYDPQLLGVVPGSGASQWAEADWDRLYKHALLQLFPEVKSRSDKRALYSLISSAEGFALRDRLIAKPELLGQREQRWLVADDDVDSYIKALRHGDDYTARLSEKQRGWLTQLADSDQLQLHFNRLFFSRGDSREPEQAGILGALVGTALTLLVTLLLAFPVGVLSAIYLEEFAPNSRFSDFIEVNINNLAAVPSIIFGLLGLAIFINFFELPRSVPLVGGLVLSLMTLPTIIIASRAAIKAVPPSIREAAMAMGASRHQVVLHHVLPLALPGMVSGTIIGLAQALGETAPLLMIGMVAFIVDIPAGVMDSATALPVQIFLWADSPERGFVEKTSAAIMVLLMFLVAVMLLAVAVRKYVEKRW